MTDSSTHWQQTLDQLSPRDIAALYAGYLLMLDDLSAASVRGAKVPGGLSTRIELANLYRMSLDDALRDLHQRNPDKFTAIWEWLALSRHAAVRHGADQMARTTSTNPPA